MAYTDDLIQNLELRPKCYIYLLASQYTPTSNDIITGQVAKKLADAKYTEIGAVQTLTIDSKRSTNVWRELDVNTAGKPVESFPGLPEYELHLERIVLYENMLLGALKFSKEYDIVKQNVPLTLQIQMWAPDTAPGQPSYAKTYYIFGVWFKSNPLEWDVDAKDDIRIIQKVDATATGISG